MSLRPPFPPQNPPRKTFDKRLQPPKLANSPPPESLLRTLSPPSPAKVYREGVDSAAFNTIAAEIASRYRPASVPFSLPNFFTTYRIFTMKTFSAKAHEVDRKWWIIDADGQILGDVAVEAARLLRGKHKPIFTPHCDTGDFVVVINADKVRLSGNKEEQKIYTRFSGWVGGQKSETPRNVREGKPQEHRGRHVH